MIPGMLATRTGPGAFAIEFETEDELRLEHRTNLSVGGLRLTTAEKLPLHSSLDLTLRGPGGAEATIRATVVAPLPDGVALSFDANADELLERLLASPDRVAPPSNPIAEEVLEPLPDSPDAEKDAERTQPLNQRLREMPRVQKIILATKADRTERAVLLQDNDPLVLSSLLKNPRITIEEVVRVAKSGFLSYQTAEVIVKTGQFMASVEVRVALIHNPKTPPQFGLRILPTLPESEVRAIARGAATSMALKQAALKRLQGGKS